MRKGRTALHSACSCRMVYGHRICHKPVVELFLLKVCKFRFEFVLHGKGVVETVSHQKGET